MSSRVQGSRREVLRLCPSGESHRNGGGYRIGASPIGEQFLSPIEAFRFGSAVGLAIKQAPEDAAVFADGIGHATVQSHEGRVARVKVQLDTDEDDVLLPDDPIVVPLWALPTRSGWSGGREEFICGNGNRSERYTIEHIGLVLLVHDDREPIVELWKYDGPVLLESHRLEVWTSDTGGERDGSSQERKVPHGVFSLKHGAFSSSMRNSVESSFQRTRPVCSQVHPLGALSHLKICLVDGMYWWKPSHEGVVSWFEKNATMES
jgi:hypothetical protein